MTDTANIKRLFLNSLKRGTGEAYLLAKENPKIDFSNQIIKSVLNIYAYDGQSEGNRAQYVFDIISIAKQKDKIRRAVLQGLANEQVHTWNLTHLFALAKLFAEQNDTEAKQAIYDRFLNYPIEYSDWVGYSEILELDGFDGLLHITEKFGQYIQQNPDNLQDDMIIQHFQDENKEIRVYEELKNKAISNQFIRIYLENIKRTQESQKKHKSKSTKYKDIIDEVLNSIAFMPLRRKRNLNDEELNKVAKRLIDEKDNLNIEKLLSIFYFYKFPLNSQLILDMAKQKPTSKNRIVEYSIYALKHLKSKEIRNFALEKIETAKKPIDFLEILVSNYQSGDFKLLSEIANKTKNEDMIEQLAGIYSDIYRTNKTKECKEPLVILYNKMNCAIHRKGIVEILIKNKVLTDTIKQEIKFDCDLNTRELVK